MLPIIFQGRTALISGAYATKTILSPVNDKWRQPKLLFSFGAKRFL